MNRLLELRNRLGQLTVRLREMIAAAEAENRDFTGDEQNNWDQINTDISNLETQIQQEERVQELERRNAAPINTPIRPGGDGEETHEAAQRATRRVFVSQRSAQPGARTFDQNWRGVDATEQEAARATAFRQFLGSERSGDYELRALQADDDESGGYTVRVEEFVARLIQAIDDQVFMRRFGTVIPLTSAQSLGVPSLDADPEDADWTGEITAADPDTQMDFGKRELTPHPVSKLIKVSKKLLRVSALDIEALLRERMAYKFAITHERGFLNGSGANQPLGVFTASANGISTGRDVSTGNSTTAIAADGLINALYNLKEGYQMRARWLFHRTAIKEIRKLKDGDGQYLWSPGLAGGQPSTILDKPYHMSEYAPSTFTTGLYVGIVGDFSYYWIADALSMQMQRLVELYAVTNQDGFIGRMESDGMPVLEEAFTRVTLA